MAETASIAKPAESIAQPKIFISYSWTTPGHKEQVRQWAERLIADGIEVVLDVYDLKEGHDKYSFMERMVTDTDITHVLVVCDKVYSEKADARKAGVGTESQIISREVYEKVQQSKFIPLVCEFSDSREPFLPTFLKSRMWIDFSSLEAVNENWEQLVRALYGKPIHQKPQLGKPPAYVAIDAAPPSSPAIAKLSTLKQALLQNKNGISLYREEFLSACIEYADALRVRSEPEFSSLGQKVLEDCGKLKNVRNQIVDWVLIESGIAPTEEFTKSLLDFLEKLLELKSRPSEIRSWNDRWFEAHSLFVYETFLYIIAALVKTGSHSTLHEVFTSHYLRPQSQRYSEHKFSNFGSFYGYAESLQAVLAPQGRIFLSQAAELVKRQADRTDIPFSSVMEAELLILLMAFVTSEATWYPQTLLYASQSEFPFFVRAARHKDFLKLANITGITDAGALREAVETGHKRLDTSRWHDFALSMSYSFWQYMNMDQLDSLK